MYSRCIAIVRAVPKHFNTYLHCDIILLITLSLFSELVNGCGASWLASVDGPFTDKFDGACNKHDHCYNCVSRQPAFR